MNRPIRNLAIGCMVLFLALLINVTYLQYWQSDALTSLSKHPDNRRVLDEAFSRPRGAIVVGGKEVAQSQKSDDQYKYQRVYPQGRMYAPITGFFSRDWGVGGIEATQNSVLSGNDSKLFVNRVVDLFGSGDPQGGSVSLTINPKAQKAAYDGLRALGDNVRGAVVALEPSTGKVLAMVSSPTYDPNRLAGHDFTAVSQAHKALLANALNPLDNRAIETVLPPGSTFKLVTAAAALESGKYQPDTMVPGGASLKLPQSTSVLPNENGGSCGGAKITLTRALQVSCNVAFGSIGLDLGADALQQQAEKFGWGQTWFHDLDDSLTRQAAAKFPHPDAPQTALSAIGQWEVSATPLQMAMVAAGIANNGTVMKPYLVDEVRSHDLEVLGKTDPQPLTANAVSAATARKLTDMMVAVVDNGTAVNAQIPGVKVAGKTGTAQSEANRPPYAWFVSFAPADSPKIAVAVLVQDAGVDRDAISGNGLAAPIAKSVMEAVLNP
ncbi:peptidoglycan D,D-transpeptidase FtsI family protein [Nocardioides pocheonensis]|uniref:Penicillin-binding protein 2 n=1 Tax=Nocardioides pocheonensis TaxID=661485 RepID=A0A3N0GKH3_9ACTN|nr:penicillin-binding protein 2 [Nocardioides pocheonensis]RNM12628.1 penicillin-binding protein 2 [Nocardioides pocheonensis]